MFRFSVVERFPPDGTVVVDGETLPTPYTVADGSLLMIAGTVDAQMADAVLAPLGLSATRTRDGRALAAIWVADFSAASLGAHGELQVSLLTAPRDEQALRDLEPGPWAFYEALSAPAPTWMVCHRLWNTTRRAVRYNDDHLGLIAEPGRGRLLRTGSRWCFDYTDEAGRTLAQGETTLTRRTTLGDAIALGRVLGPRRSLRLAGRTPPSIWVVSPRVDQEGALAVARTYTQASRTSYRAWTEADRLTLDDPELARLGFHPDLVAGLSGLKFVYLRPEQVRLG